MEERGEIMQIFKSFLRILYEIIKTVAFIVLVFIVVRYFLIQPFLVDGNSMEPNFHDNEYLLIQKISYRFKEPARGDVVIFHPPQKSVYYIKRVVALPGEKIVINEDKVMIYNKERPDGFELNESYVKQYEQTNGDLSQTLKSDEYFVMGDNRENSSDSREFGPIDHKNIAGKVFVTIFPFSDFGTIKPIQYSNLKSIFAASW